MRTKNAVSAALIAYAIDCANRAADWSRQVGTTRDGFQDYPLCGAVYAARNAAEFARNAQMFAAAAQNAEKEPDAHKWVVTYQTVSHYGGTLEWKAPQFFASEYDTMTHVIQEIRAGYCEPTVSHYTNINGETSRHYMRDGEGEGIISLIYNEANDENPEYFVTSIIGRWDGKGETEIWVTDTDT